MEAVDCAHRFVGITHNTRVAQAPTALTIEKRFETLAEAAMSIEVRKFFI
jgi:hypothetical protein